VPLTADNKDKSILLHVIVGTGTIGRGGPQIGLIFVRRPANLIDPPTALESTRSAKKPATVGLFTVAKSGPKTFSI
jgi:hypothetical protein